MSEPVAPLGLLKRRILSAIHKQTDAGMLLQIARTLGLRTDPETSKERRDRCRSS